MTRPDLSAWAVQWHSDNALDGCRRHLVWSRDPDGEFRPFRLFRTRAECRAYIEAKYGYIRERPDLRREPHGWHVPTAVMVTVNRASPDRR